MSMNLQGKVALVTGAARGIGRAVAEAFAAAGARHVVAADVQEDLLAELPTGKGLSTARLDVTQEAGWQSLVAQTVKAHGGIDVLVNNAGVLLFKLVEETTAEEFRRLLEVNLMGVFLGMKAAIPPMKQAGQGSIVNVSSASGLLPSNAIGAYAATKYAVRGLSRSAALELGPAGIRVNSVHPGGVNTPMTNPTQAPAEEVNKNYVGLPLQRSCEPEEIAQGILFLASDAGSYCNGTELTLDGGMTAGLYFPGMPGSPI